MNKKKIMIVEDDNDLAKGLKVLLKANDYKPICINKEFEKIEGIVKKEKPHLIFMDIQLIGISGIDLVCQLKANPKTTDIPVIALTALTRPEQVKKIMGESGCDGYIGKPFQTEDFLNIMEIYLNRK